MYIYIQIYIWTHQNIKNQGQREFFHLLSFFFAYNFIYFIFGYHGSSLVHVLFLVSGSERYSLVVVGSLLIAVALAGGRGGGSNSFHARALELRLNVTITVHGLSYSAVCGIFLGSNPCLLHLQVDSLPLSHQGSLKRES